MKKIERSPLDPFVKWFFPKLLPYIPRWMSANMITSIGILLCFLSGLCLALTEYSHALFYLAAFLFFLTWVTDTLDGVVARARGKESRLGHYLDHFGDSWAIIFVGLGLYVSDGSHILIGLICCVVYLMLQMDGHIKVQITDTLELPPFGPTEIRLVIMAAMIAAAHIDPGQPLSWWPEITGENGWLANALGFDIGMSFLDAAGFVVAACAALGLVGETFFMVRRFAREDRDAEPAKRRDGDD